MEPLEQLTARARERSWQRFGRRILFALPGMFCCDGTRGRYPALSITGAACGLGCEHCRGTLLQPMLPATEPEALVARCQTLARDGHLGVLVSGGCDRQGRLPWSRFLPALAAIKATTALAVSVHAGFVDEAIARGFKEAGVDQVLLDIVGSADTYRKICHIDAGPARLETTLAALTQARLDVVPHIICGLHDGQMQGETHALELVAALRPRQLVIVSFMNLPGTPMAHVPPPAPEDVARLLATARLRLPDTELSLGCARPRGDDRLERLAIAAGVNRLALPSAQARQDAADLGLAVTYRQTCCCANQGPDAAPW